MVIPRPGAAQQFLGRTGFARFLDYAGHFGRQGHYPGTEFRQVQRLIERDERLRLHVLRGIQLLEVGIRTRTDEHLSLTHHAHWYADPQVLPREHILPPPPPGPEGEEAKPQFQRTLMPAEDIAARGYAEYLRSRESAAAGHRQRHGLVQLPPSWLVTELVSFGVWSRVYATLQPGDQQAIAAQFGLHRGDFKPWLQDLTVLHNASAHHARLWNRRFRGGRLYEPDPEACGLKERSYRSERPETSLAPRLYAMHRLLLPLGERAWSRDLRRVVGDFAELGVEHLGFQEGWEEQPEWQAP